MKIIISPAKIMKEEVFGVDVKSTPVFIDDALFIWDFLKKQSDDNLKKIWDANNDIINQNKNRLARYDLKSNLIPALLCYDGLQFKKMAANVFNEDMWKFINKHLVILSGLYGYLRPLDGINPYRLMMGANICLNDFKSLYEYWGDRIYLKLVENDHEILNLASKEYSDVITPFLKNDVKMISVSFLSKNKKGELVVKSTEAKSCRGAMVRFIAEHEINDFESIKYFHDFNYRFDADLSTKDNFTFVKQDYLKIDD